MGKIKKDDYDIDYVDLDLGDIEGMIGDAIPSPALVEFYRNLKNRKIVWNQYVSDAILNVALYIMRWNMEDRDKPVEDRMPIRIYINTEGGDLNSVLALADVIALSKTPVHTIGVGICYSAGGLLLMSGHKRYLLPNTSVLIHDGSTGAIGNVAKVMDNLEFTKESEERLKDYIVGHTKISKKLLEKNYRRDWFLFADEAIELGVADEIVKDLDTII